MYNENDPWRDGEQTENPFPYSSYYTDDKHIYVDTQPRRKRSWVVVLVCVLMVVAAGVCTFFTSYALQIDNADGNLSISIYRKDAAEPPGELVVGEPLPSAAISAEAPAEKVKPAFNYGDGTTLILKDVKEDEEPLTLKEVYAKVAPSVVSVLCESYNTESSGTGIIMTPGGYIITNNHVVSGSNNITVETDGGEIYTAVLIGSDEISDLAVIKIDSEDLPAAEFGRSDNLTVGDEVSAIGNPLGAELRGTFTNGIISAINRDIEVDGRKMTLIQTNAALNAGNSGGPLINSYGQVIGINTMKMRSYYSYVEGLGFAIPISLAKPIVDELIDKGFVAGRPAIGITGDELPASTAAYYRMPQGVYVTGVDERSDAYAQGLRPKDIIIAVNDTSVATMNELKAIKNNFSAGESIKLTYYNPADGELHEINVVLMDQADLTDN